MKNKFILLAICLVLVNISFAQYIVITSAPVNFREMPASNSKLVGSLQQNFVIFEKVAESEYTEVINVWNYPHRLNWIQFNLGNFPCYVYALFMEKFDTYDEALQFIELNKSQYSKLQGSKMLSPQYLETMEVKPYDSEEALLFNRHYVGPDYSYYFQFGEDGVFDIEIQGVIGDHIESMKGNGRYLVFSDGTALFRAGLKGEFAPDGYTWAEYYELDMGKAPTQTELKQYMKEKGSFNEYFELIIDTKDFENIFKSTE